MDRTCARVWTLSIADLSDCSQCWCSVVDSDRRNKYPPGERWDEPSGQDRLGSGPLHRAYRTRDGWFFIGARQEDAPRLAAMDGLAGITSLHGEALEQALEAHFSGDTVAHWVERLTRAGIGTHRHIADLEALMQDLLVTEHGLSLTREHDDIGLVTTCGPAPRLSSTPIAPGQLAPKPGADGPDILTEIGLGDCIEALIEAGVVRVDGVAAG
jgi:crotonobetainyl-CoA:carnitine CoA-transferase CaiB-like acyl-CoA transferase